MPFAPSLERRTRWLIFAGVFAVALAFAAYTQHAWEDYYITYRVSKNLATGHGLVYTVGERVHAFTSPLNVLIPAALSVLTGNRLDELVLWLFRVVSSLLLAGAAVLLFDSARKNCLSWIPTVVLVGMFGLDAKIVDFSINGQEAAFMMFFLALALHALTVRSGWTALKLGLAGGGLMWTRPDGFIYLGAVAVGFLLFNAWAGDWAVAAWAAQGPLWARAHSQPCYTCLGFCGPGTTTGRPYHTPSLPKVCFGWGLRCKPVPC